jgi:hypothetical protein
LPPAALFAAQISIHGGVKDHLLSPSFCTAASTRCRRGARGRASGERLFELIPSRGERVPGSHFAPVVRARRSRRCSEAWGGESAPVAQDLGPIVGERPPKTICNNAYPDQPKRGW